ncbi:Ig-like domain-containing protein [Deinococcus sp.]|uniref:Ig-like domain-containing protein n=1 Tax=Deinococcus sp. TaxID=47478 RepID=UPI0025EA498C|nr:Ig-like domain-containing protein [Deinococcus sp.]
MKNRTLFSASALALLSLSLSACGGGGTTTPPVVVTPDITPPSIVSVSPAVGAIGVAKTASVVVTFSEAMNQSSAQAAFQSADLGANTISWNTDGTVMTVKPNAELAYTALGKSYSFSVSNTATDVKGNALSNPASTSSFKTFRQLSSSLPIKAGTVGEIDNAQTIKPINFDIEVGDQTDNTSRRGFVGFDLSSLPTDLVPANVLSAQVRMFVNSPINGSPFSKLFPSCTGKFCILQNKSVVLDHVAYGNTVSGSVYNIPAIPGSDPTGLTDETPCGGAIIICLFKGTSTGWNLGNVTPWVQDDLSNRAARGNLTEVRMSFPLATNADGKADNIDISNSTNKAQLTVTYLMP